MIAVVSPSRTSTSGRAIDGMKFCRNALYVSLISRCDSAAIVPNTSDDLPEPETPVNTVNRRLGISTLTSFRLFSRAPCTRIRSWRSAGCCLVAVIGSIMSSSLDRCLYCDDGSRPGSVTEVATQRGESLDEFPLTRSVRLRPDHGDRGRSCGSG